MTNIPNGGPSVTEINRRLQRVEDKLDERTATVDMLTALEKLFQARELSQAAAIQNLETRLGRLESANSKLMVGVVLAFLGLLIQVIVQVLQSGAKP